MATMYQAQVSVDGSPWKPVGPTMSHRVLVEANIDGYRNQVAEKAPHLVGHYVFRVVEVNV